MGIFQLAVIKLRSSAAVPCQAPTHVVNREFGHSRDECGRPCPATAAVTRLNVAMHRTIPHRPPFEHLAARRSSMAYGRSWTVMQYTVATPNTRL